MACRQFVTDVPTGSYRHGTRYAYRVKGCRCPDCRKWNAASRRRDRRLYRLSEQKQSD